VEGEILMENAPDDTTTKENNENEEKMTEIEDIRASHDVDAIMTDDTDEEIVFKQDHGRTMGTGSDSKDTSSSSSSSDSSSSSESESDATSEVSSEVVVTKVVQDEAYQKPDDWSSDNNATEVQSAVTATTATNGNTAKGKQDDEAFITVTNKNKKKYTKKPTKTDETNNAARMERANRLVQSMDHESDPEESKKDYEMTQSKYKIGKLTATATKLRNTTVKKKKNIHKKGQDAIWGPVGVPPGKVGSWPGFARRMYGVPGAAKA
jgi:hypothetical protein